MDSAFHRFLNKIYTAQRVKTDGISSGLTRKCDDLIETRGTYPSQDQRLSLFMQIAEREKDLALFATTPAQKDLIASNLARMGAALFESATTTDRSYPDRVFSAAMSIFASIAKMDVSKDVADENISGPYEIGLMGVINKQDERLSLSLAKGATAVLDQEPQSALLGRIAEPLFLLAKQLVRNESLDVKRTALDLLLSLAEKMQNPSLTFINATYALRELSTFAPADTLYHIDRAERIALLHEKAAPHFEEEPVFHTESIFFLASALKVISEKFCAGEHFPASAAQLYRTLDRVQGLFDSDPIKNLLRDPEQDLSWISQTLSKFEDAFQECGTPLPVPQPRPKATTETRPSGLSWLTQAVSAYRRLSCER